MKQKILRQIQILRIVFFGIDLKIVIRVREKGNSYLMSTELGKMPSDVAFLSSLHPCGANRGSWIQNLYNLSVNNCPKHCLIKHLCLYALVHFLDDCYSNFLGNFLICFFNMDTLDNLWWAQLALQNIQHRDYFGHLSFFIDEFSASTIIK